MPGSTKDEALKLVAEFEAQTSAGVFSQIDQSSVAAGLRARVANPSRIDQGPSSLCGSASIIYSLATADPVAYVRLVKDIYSNGVAWLGKRKIEPGSDLKKYRPPKDIDPADWIPLASIRDSENWMLDYESVDDQAAGITLPSSMVKWLRDLGYQSVVDQTNVFFTKSADNLEGAASLRNATLANNSDAWWVFLFINAQMLSTDTQSNHSWTPNHWIVLLSAVISTSSGSTSPGRRTMSTSVRLEYYTWGQKFVRTWEESALLKNYYGYIKCRY